MERVIPCTPAFHGMVEERFQRRTRRRYVRYVIVSDEGTPLFDGYAGDLEEANQTIRAHIQLLKQQVGFATPTVVF